MYQSFIIFILSLALSVTAYAKPKVVPTAEQILKNEDKDAETVQFAKLIFNVPSSNYLGRGGTLGGLFGCIQRFPVELESSIFSVNNAVYNDVFIETMKQANYNLAGDPSNLFEKRNDLGRYLIAAMITDFEIDYCDRHDPERIIPLPVGKGDGQLYMKLEWQVYDTKKKTIVLKKATEGYSQFKKLKAQVLLALLKSTFKNSLINFLAEDDLLKVLDPVNTNTQDPEFDGLKINILDSLEVEKPTSIADAQQSVVTIKVPNSHGSGFVISKDGYILTNQHVVDNEETVTVVFQNGFEVEANVIRRAPDRDVALIKVPMKLPKALPIKMNEPELGVNVYAIGAPLDTDLSGTVSQGIVSAFRMIDDKEFIQSDTTIYGGNSGGPLLDEDGNIVGISVMGRRDVETINFFIPIKFAIDALSINKSPSAASKYTAAE